MSIILEIVLIKCYIKPRHDVHLSFQHLGSRGKHISLSSRLACSILPVLVQLRLHSETLSEKIMRPFGLLLVFHRTLV